MMTPDFSPYKGLQPFTEADRPYFFGRERDQEIIASNLYAAPLTILYGSSGVGKSSVLMAGVVPQLRQTPRLALVVFRTWQDPSFISALKSQIADAVSRSTGKSVNVEATLPLDEFLLQLAHVLRGSIFCVFDQFEEYFLYHDALPGEEGFDAELARAVNRREVAANFLLALREDGLSKLDRFKGRIPNLLGNMLRLEHLDHDSASRAIRKPLEEYNRHLPTGQPPMTIEDELVEAVIEQVRTGQVSLDQKGAAPAVQAATASGQDRVETPYLQLVMTRMWDEEHKAKSNTLRLATLKRLGGANQIVRTHLDGTMAQLSNADRLIAARAFRFLVTPSGTKIAYTAGDLANYAEVAPGRLTPVLLKLSSPEVRVLRAVAPPGGEAQEPRYEIFHDVLAPAILDWRERYLSSDRTRKRQLLAVALGAVALFIIGGLLFNLQTTRAQLQQTSQQAQDLSAQLVSLPKAERGRVVFLGGVQGTPNSQLMLLNVKSGQVALLPLNLDRFQNGFVNAPALSHDGKRLAFVGLLPGAKFRIFTMALDGSEPKQLGQGEGQWSDVAPAWSPDDSQLAFATNRDGNFEIYVMGADGGNPRRLSRTPNDSTNPTWSPDGSHIALAEDVGGRHDLYLMSVGDGSFSAGLLQDPDVDATDPAWSPRGDMIAYTAKPTGGGRFFIKIFNMSGKKNPTLPCPGDAYCWAPTWSPDGGLLGFVATNSSTEQSGEIYYTDPSGQYATNRLTNGVFVNIFRPTWGPDPENLK